LRAAKRYRWSVVAVLICIAAIVIELGIFIATMNSPGALDTAAAKAGIVTSVICAVSGAAGLRHQASLAIPELGVAVGILGLLLYIGLEAVSEACFVCF
jgi:hypothetical protein